MRGKHIKRGLALAGIAGLALSATFLAAPVSARAELPAGPPAKSTSIVSHDNVLTSKVTKRITGTGVEAQAKALADYWTPARMKAAKSLERTANRSDSARQRTQQSALQGTAGSVAPSRTSKVSAKIAPQYSQPNLPSNTPAARTNGKVFFSHDGGNYVCSAAVVNSEGKSLIWTAGHCLGEDGVWSSNVVFVPAYSNGTAPYGVWYAKNIATTSRWFNNHDWAYDVGAVTLHANFGYRIADYLGAQGIKWGEKTKTFTAAAFGYPADDPFDGETLYRADGKTTDKGDGTLFMTSGLTGGSSGGPWFRNFDGDWGYVNGHNDFIYLDAPLYMYSPYYGAQVADLYTHVRKMSADAVSGPTPKISGTAKVGKKLTAKPGTWKPSGTKLSYQWYRNSTKISGATKSTYKLVKADKKKKITVKVTGKKDGYANTTKTSAKTKTVK
ncbi:hypothetical protein [Micropruina sp.]|uniref:trypsin-like serine peptidase n=1 Tax=Micropruina sp. TaxID=2737536 RepID=UPI00262DF52E|nr:hypothetical protein [Micropruina sp.]